MGKKKNSCHHHDDDGGAQKQDAGGEKKKDNKNTNNVVLKTEMHCEGCASKIIKLARSFEGVESVKADADSQKITVIGKVDPSQIRDFLHSKTKKKVEIISPQFKKEDSNAKNDNNQKSDGKKPADTTTNNKNTSDNNNNNKPKDNKKEAPVVTAVIKVAFHCLGCIQKINKIVSKTKGVQEVTLDKQKETVTVKGTMDVKALTEVLKQRLKRPVEIVPPKKEKDGEKETAGEGKKKSGGGSESQGGSKGGGGSGGGGGDVGGKVVEGNKMEYMVQPGYGFDPGYGYMGQPVYGNGYMGAPMPVYGNGYVGMPPPAVPAYDYGYGYGHVHVPGYPVHMKFNDENPNACTVM